MVGGAINEKWQAFMAPYFESISCRLDENMVQPEEVLHLD
jgi:hypothetical protein